MFRPSDDLRAAESRELDETAALEGLTSVQYQFARAVFSGANYTEAFRLVTDVSGMNDTTIGKRAAEMGALPLVQAKIKALRVEADQKATLAPNLTASFVLNGIQNLALNADTDAVRLAAYVHLGKSRLINLFGNQAPDQERKPRTQEEVERELRKFLAELSPTVEATARDVTPAKPATPRRKRKA